MSKYSITPERIQTLLRYDPNTGIFVWKHRDNPNFRFGGQIAGSVNSRGYLMICLDRYRFPAHQIAWAIMTNEWVPEIDHINKTKLDNRWANLRSVSHQENCFNKTLNKNNSSGVPGVTRHREKWQAQIRVNGQLLFLGTFDTKEEAAFARDAAKHKYHVIKSEEDKKMLDVSN